MLTPIKKQGDEHIYILLQFNIIDCMSVCYVDIRRFVWMLISSEITWIYLWRSCLNPATSSSTWCWCWFQTAVAIKQKTAIISSTWRPFQECLENMRKSRNWWCGWFRGFFFRYSSSDTSASTSISFPESFATCFGDLLDSLHIFKIQIATNVNLYPDVNINISWILFFIPLLRCARRPWCAPLKRGLAGLTSRHQTTGRVRVFATVGLKY